MTPDLPATEVELRENLRRSIGYSRRAAIEEAIRQIESQHVVVILGPEGCEQERLARSIHRASTRWERGFVTINRRTVLGPSAERALLSQAHQGTVFVDVAALEPTPRVRGRMLGPALVRGLLGWYRGLDVRPIFSAKDMRQLSFVLGAAASGDAIHVRGVAARWREVPRIVQSMLAEFGSVHRLDELAPAFRERMQHGRWQRNLETLREHIALLDAYLTGRSLRQVGGELNIKRSTLYDRLARAYGIGYTARRR